MHSAADRPDLKPYRVALLTGGLVVIVALILTITVDKAWVIVLIVVAFALAGLMFWLAWSQRRAQGGRPR